MSSPPRSHSSPSPSPSASSSSSSSSVIPVQPDHFYPTPFIRTEPEQSRSPSPSSAYLDPDDDPYATRGIPVFKPTWDEFQDFEAYVSRCEVWGRNSGVIKIIPPREWKDSLPSVVPQLADVKLRHPIAQHMIGRGGLFRQNNVEKRKTFTVREWAELCSKEGFRAPSLVEKERGEEGTKVASRAVARGRRPRKKKAESDDEKDQEINEEGDEEMQDHAERMQTEDEPTRDSQDGASHTPQAGPPTPVSLPDTKTSTPVAPASAASTDKAFLSEFKPEVSWLPPSTSAEDYTPEACRELERAFWRSCGIGDPALYGADMKGSLFTDQTKAWNVSCLPSPLSRLLSLAHRQLPGVNTPYLYFGMWRAAFAWHVEDMDLYSINYIHFGAPKVWWAIPSGKADAFERVMKGYFPGDSKSCSQFLRHKSYLVSPTMLSQSSLRPNTLVQRQGEFVITFPRGYHAGINLGLNCAESVNFALEGWEDVSRKAQWCSCEEDSVRLDIDGLLREAAKARVRTIAKPAKPSAPRKRKSEASTSELPAKKLKLSTTTPVVRIKLAPLAPPPPPEKKCCLCPSGDVVGLLRVHDVPAHLAKGKPGAAATEETWAHETCAMVLPETWVDTLQDGDEKWVFGVDGIEKARWDLKCTACTRTLQKAHGAKIQCTRGKCPRAFHVSCARDRPEVRYVEQSEVQHEVVLAPWAADSAESVTPEAAAVPLKIGEEKPPVVLKTVKKLIVEVLCATHNPEQLQVKKQRKDEQKRKQAMSLSPGDRIRVRVSSGVFEVTLVRVDDVGEKVEVAWDDGSGNRELKWGSIVWGSVTLTPKPPSHHQLETAEVSNPGLRPAQPADREEPKAHSVATSKAITSGPPSSLQKVDGMHGQVPAPRWQLPRIPKKSDLAQPQTPLVEQGESQLCVPKGPHLLPERPLSPRPSHVERYLEKPYVPVPRVRRIEEYAPSQGREINPPHPQNYGSRAEDGYGNRDVDGYWARKDRDYRDQWRAYYDSQQRSASAYPGYGQGRRDATSLRDDRPSNGGRETDPSIYRKPASREGHPSEYWSDDDYYRREGPEWEYARPSGGQYSRAQGRDWYRVPRNEAYQDPRQHQDAEQYGPDHGRRQNGFYASQQYYPYPYAPGGYAPSHAAAPSSQAYAEAAWPASTDYSLHSHPPMFNEHTAAAVGSSMGAPGHAVQSSLSNQALMQLLTSEPVRSALQSLRTASSNDHSVAPETAVWP